MGLIRSGAAEAAPAIPALESVLGSHLCVAVFGGDAEVTEPVVSSELVVGKVK